jgi:hypothetical protein
MRYVTIPEPLMLECFADPKTGKPPLRYGFDAFLREYIWTWSGWRETADTLDLALQLHSELAREPGDVVELTDEEHEKLSIAARAPNYAPTVAGEFLIYLKAIIGAARSRPYNHALHVAEVADRIVQVEAARAAAKEGAAT